MISDNLKKKKIQLYIPKVVPEGVPVVGEGGGGAGVPLLWAGAQRCREVEAQVDGVAHLHSNIVSLVLEMIIKTIR